MRDNYYKDFAEKSVERFYKTLINGIGTLLEEKMITEKMTVKELLAICKKRKENK